MHKYLAGLKGNPLVNNLNFTNNTELNLINSKSQQDIWQWQSCLALRDRLYFKIRIADIILVITSYSGTL